MTSPEALYLITRTAAHANQLKQLIILRDFDEVIHVPIEEALSKLQTARPSLALIDCEGDEALLEQLMQAIAPLSMKSIVLADRFDEALFVTCHDAGTRDFLVKPVPDAYLISRVILALQEARQSKQSKQKDELLVTLGALSPVTRVLRTAHIIQQLQTLMDVSTEGTGTPQPTALLSLVMIQLEGLPNEPHPLNHRIRNEAAQVLRQVARGGDLIGEYFGDKFIVLMPQTTLQGARPFAKRIMERLNGRRFKTAERAQEEYSLKIRVGFAESGTCHNEEDLLNTALKNLTQEASPVSQGVLHPV